ncbi:MAG: chemotaxis-specific protein-glutamate methyltransferase CheB [SAR324 cluster bacterium]|nr:chemotaxis-specific protein-glutamate methyltransferase CheB [SAR324 cluster bacterium]
MAAVKVLVVDGSALVRNFFKKELGLRAEIELLGLAKGAVDARDLIVELKPEVVLLDLSLPKALDFIAVLMEHWPLPIVVLSSKFADEKERGEKALSLGAVQFLEKPKPTSKESTLEINTLVKAILGVKGKKALARRSLPQGSQKSGKVASTSGVGSNSNATTSPNANSEGLVPLHLQSDRLIAIGASTGGTEAIKAVLVKIPSGLPGIVMVQHMPEGFTHSFAERLNSLSPNLEVREAVNGEEVYPGLCLLAPGDKHMEVERNSGRYFVKVYKGDLVNRHMPSVDVLFDSVAKVVGKKSIGVILTGMGADGAKGLLNMRNSGAQTMNQDEESCVVYGMPREAHLIGASEKEVPLDQVASAISNAFKKIK